MDFFLRDSDEQKAQGATHMDDLDLILSPIDGALVVVAMKGGRHACWQCGEFFDESNPKLKGVEVKLGYSRIQLHAQCMNGKPRMSLYLDNLRGMQVRRFFASATKRLGEIVSKKDKRIVTG